MAKNFRFTVVRGIHCMKDKTIVRKGETFESHEDLRKKFKNKFRLHGDRNTNAPDDGGGDNVPPDPVEPIDVTDQFADQVEGTDITVVKIDKIYSIRDAGEEFATETAKTRVVSIIEDYLVNGGEEGDDGE